MEVAPGKAALVLAGGGARAAYQVGVLQAIKEMLPDPAMTPARNSVTGTRPCRNVAPVSMRERICGAMCCSGSASPPR